MAWARHGVGATWRGRDATWRLRGHGRGRDFSSVPRVPSEQLQNARTLETLKREVYLSQSSSSSSASFRWLVLDTRSQESREMSGGHDEGHGGGHGAHLDRADAADTMAPFNPVYNTLWHTLAVKNSKRISEQKNGVRCVERLRIQPVLPLIAITL
jgi:hypothetical protein